jgi:DNA-binding response OmpR family regulator
MEKHSYLMLLDSDHTVLNTLKQFIEMQSTSESSGQFDMLSLLSENVPNLVLVDISLPTDVDKNNLEMMRNCSSAPVIKISAKCEVATLSNVLEMITEASSHNESLKALDSMSHLISKIGKGTTTKFSEN